MGMHAAQPPVQLLGQTPRLAAVEDGRENDRLVDRLFGFVGNGCGGEDAGAQGAKCLATRLDAGVKKRSQVNENKCALPPLHALSLTNLGSVRVGRYRRRSASCSQVACSTSIPERPEEGTTGRGRGGKSAEESTMIVTDAAKRRVLPRKKIGVSPASELSRYRKEPQCQHQPWRYKCSKREWS